MESTAAPPAQQPAAGKMHWVGPPLRVEQGIAHFRSFQSDSLGQQFFLGDHVYLQPAEQGVPLYIAQIVDLFQRPQPAAAGGNGGAAAAEGRMYAQVTWLYRPEELDLDSPLPVGPDEVFGADEVALHPLESVCGRCYVVRPSQRAERVAGEADVYTCSRKYIPAEGRVVPVDGVAPDAQAKPLLLVHGRLYPNTGRQLAEAALSREAAPSVPRGTSKRKRREREHYSPEPSGGGRAQPTAGGPPPALKRERPSPPRSGALGGTGSASTSAGPATSGTPPGAGGLQAGGTTPRARLAREAHGRWTKDRYDSAQRSLIGILRGMGATSPDKAVLRPHLREEARKVIGDTGLLDHLLKHLADQVVSVDGERLRRRHNREGHMEYHLQHPAVAEKEEEMLREEMGALSSELREVREARHILQAVRSEAAQAIQAVTGIKEHPDEVGRALAAVGEPAPAGTTGEVLKRVEGTEQSVVDILRRLYDAESLAATGLEEVRGEASEGGRLIAEQVAAFARTTAALEARCTELERQASVAAEDAAGRFEALAGALGEVKTLKEALHRSEAVIKSLQGEVAGLKERMGGPPATAAAEAYAPPQPSPQPDQQQRPAEGPISPAGKQGTKGRPVAPLGNEGPPPPAPELSPAALIAADLSPAQMGATVSATATAELQEPSLLHRLLRPKAPL